jgi:hypothetical protein
MQRPYLIFDKSSLESLNIDEAVLLDTFFSCVITPIFFVECLADLEKEIRSKSTPEQLVGSLADRTPEYESCVTLHHLDVLRWELTGKCSLLRLKGGPFVAGAKSVQLGDQRGVIFQQTKEMEAMQRWTARDFLAAERQIAKAWRKSLTSIDFDGMVKVAMAEIGQHWRKPRTLQDAREMTDIIIDQMDQQWLLGFGMDLLGVSDLKEQALSDWLARRRPPLRQCFPYFIFMLSVNLFFCLVLPTQLLRNVKQSHHVDLAYLYYLPFCSIFTSKDHFHTQIVPLFLTADQSFVGGIELKDDLKKLDERFSALSEAEFKAGTTSFADQPPDDQSFLTTRLWDKHVPKWRDAPKPAKVDKDLHDALTEMMKKVSGSASVAPHNIDSVAELGYVSIESKIHLRKGKYRRYSEEMEQRIIESENKPE